MIRVNEYYLIAFETTTAAMEAEAYLKPHFSIAIMPVPREITSGCGLAVRFQNPNIEEILAFLKKSPLTGSLYKMGTSKLNGKRPVECLLTLKKV